MTAKEHRHEFPPFSYAPRVLFFYLLLYKFRRRIGTTIHQRTIGTNLGGLIPL